MVRPYLNLQYQSNQYTGEIRDRFHALSYMLDLGLNLYIYVHMYIYVYMYMKAMKLESR